MYDKIVLLPTARVYNSFIITILLDFFKKSEWISSGPSDQATRTVIAKYWLLPDRSDCVTQPRIWHIRVLYCTSKINNGYSSRVLYFLPLVYERCCPACVGPSNRLGPIWFRQSHRAALGEGLIFGPVLIMQVTDPRCVPLL